MSIQMPMDGPFQLLAMGLGELAASVHPTRLAARRHPTLSAATLAVLQKCSGTPAPGKLQPEFVACWAGQTSFQPIKTSSHVLSAYFGAAARMLLRLAVPERIANTATGGAGLVPSPSQQSR